MIGEIFNPRLLKKLVINIRGAKGVAGNQKHIGADDQIGRETGNDGNVTNTRRQNEKLARNAVGDKGLSAGIGGWTTIGANRSKGRERGGNSLDGVKNTVRTRNEIGNLHGNGTVSTKLQSKHIAKGVLKQLLERKSNVGG